MEIGTYIRICSMSINIRTYVLLTPVLLPPCAARVPLWSAQSGPRPDRGPVPAATPPSWSWTAREREGGEGVVRGHE